MNHKYGIYTIIERDGTFNLIRPVMYGEFQSSESVGLFDSFDEARDAADRL